MVNKLQAVETKIRELVPRLQKSSPGCQYAFQRSWALNEALTFEAGDVVTLCHLDTKYSSDFVYERIRGVFQIPKIEIQHMKAIGHQITLEPVLEALSKMGFPVDYGVSFKGEFIEPGVDEQILSGASWQYGKPLSEQSPEMIDLLHKLLDA